MSMSSHAQATALPHAYVREFILHQQLRGRRVETLKAYESFLNRFLKIIHKQVAQITVHDVRQFLLAESARGNKQSSLATKIAILRSFFGWLTREEYIDKDPMNRIDRPKLPPSAPKYLTHDEMEALREAATELIDKLIIEMLYSTGVRVTELIKLNWDDIDTNTKQAIIRDGKGGKSRVVPISTKAIRLLKQYRATRQDDNPWIFESRYKRRMVKETIERRVRKLGKKAGIQKTVTPHRLRHSQATHLLDAGMPINMVQKILGHASVSTTQIYARTQMAGVEQYYRRLFP